MTHLKFPVPSTSMLKSRWFMRDAIVVDVAPQFANFASFCAHEPVGSDRISGDTAISNIETGALVAVGNGMDDAMQKATAKLNKMKGRELRVYMLKAMKRLRLENLTHEVTEDA